MQKILHPKDSTEVSGVVYAAGKPDLLDENLERLREEVGTAVGYDVKARASSELGALAAR